MKLTLDYSQYQLCQCYNDNMFQTTTISFRSRSALYGVCNTLEVLITSYKNRSISLLLHVSVTPPQTGKSLFIIYLFIYRFTAQVLKVCRTPGPTACSRLRLAKVCLKN